MGMPLALTDLMPGRPGVTKPFDERPHDPSEEFRRRLLDTLSRGNLPVPPEIEAGRQRAQRSRQLADEGGGIRDFLMAGALGAGHALANRPEGDDSFGQGLGRGLVGGITARQQTQQRRNAEARAEEEHTRALYDTHLSQSRSLAQLLIDDADLERKRRDDAFNQGVARRREDRLDRESVSRIAADESLVRQRDAGIENDRIRTQNDTRRANAYVSREGTAPDKSFDISDAHLYAVSRVQTATGLSLEEIEESLALGDPPNVAQLYRDFLNDYESGKRSRPDFGDVRGGSSTGRP